MNVRPDVLRGVVIDDTFDPVDINASGGCVSADQPTGHGGNYLDFIMFLWALLENNHNKSDMGTESCTSVLHRFKS